MVLGGLLLNVVAALTPLNWLALLGLIASSGYLIAFTRRTPSERRSLWPLPMTTWTLSPRDAVLYSGAAVVVILAFAISTGESRKLHQQTDFTEFWITPDRTAEIGTVKIGMKNVEHRPRSYDIELMLDDQMIGVLAKHRSARKRELEQDDRSSRPEPTPTSRGLAVQVREHQKVYRRVWLASREPA